MPIRHGSDRPPSERRRSGTEFDSILRRRAAESARRKRRLRFGGRSGQSLACAIGRLGPLRRAIGRAPEVPLVERIGD
ncbi:MAG TPA: hypothetical protein DCQ98_03550 [Planctomycetaceae bacterium]|nr:hypothetical protein [Planctomycetaceae bacterium]